MGREGGCAVFSVEVTIVLLLAADSITALYCFSQLLKISLGLASFVSSAASLSHLPPSLVTQGTLTSKMVHYYPPWGLGQKSSHTLVYMDGSGTDKVCQGLLPTQGQAGGLQK